LISAAASFGMMPPSASVSTTANSTSSHLWYLFWSSQILPIWGRV